MQIARWISLSAALGVSVISGACGDGGTGPAGGDSASYVLEGVNEDAVPEDEPMDWGTARFRSGSLRILGGGTWEMTIEFERVEAGDAQTLEDYGRYDREGDDLYFLSQAYGDQFDGTIDGDMVVVTYDFDGNGEYETDFTFVE